MEKQWEHVENFKDTTTIYYKYNLECEVGIIKINRPEQLNALNKYVLHDLEDILNQMGKDTRVRSIIITGEGNKAFVAGADIKEFQHFNKKEAYNLSQSGKEKVFNK